MIDTLCQSVCQHLDPLTALILMLFTGGLFTTVGFVAVVVLSGWMKKRGWM